MVSNERGTRHRSLLLEHLAQTKVAFLLPLIVVGRTVDTMISDGEVSRYESVDGIKSSMLQVLEVGDIVMKSSEGELGASDENDDCN